MSKFFMYSTRLQEFEQMMMLVANFSKRGKGLIVLKDVPFTKEDVACRFCTEYSKCKNDESKCVVLSERLKANEVCYENIVRKTFKDIREYNFKKRLIKLISEFNGDFFCDSSHQQRFENIINTNNRAVKNIDYQFFATLFMLTADHEGVTTEYDQQIENLRHQMTSVSEEFDVEYKKLSERINELKIAKIGVVQAQKNVENYAQRVEELDKTIGNVNPQIREFYQDLVKRLISTIRVHKGMKLEIQFYSGIVVKQNVDYYE